MVSRLLVGSVSKGIRYDSRSQLTQCSSSMANIRTTTPSIPRSELRRFRNRLHVLRDQSGSNTLSQHHLPHSPTCQCTSRSALRCYSPSRRTQHSRLGRSRMGRQHDPQSAHSLLPQRTETNRLIAMGHVSHPPQHQPSRY
jgi:hypothetical protein